MPLSPRIRETLSVAWGGRYSRGMGAHSDAVPTPLDLALWLDHQYSWMHLAAGAAGHTAYYVRSGGETELGHFVITPEGGNTA